MIQPSYYFNIFSHKQDLPLTLRTHYKSRHEAWAASSGTLNRLYIIRVTLKPR